MISGRTQGGAKKLTKRIPAAKGSAPNPISTGAIMLLASNASRYMTGKRGDGGRRGFLLT